MSRLEVLVLGGLTARVGETAIELGTPKQRAVFAMLALNAGQLVTVDELVDELWPDDPPPSAVANVRSYAGRLRRLVSDQSQGSQVQRLAKGYRLDIEDGSVDVVDFFADTAAARRCIERAEPEDAAALLRAAIDRWKGPLLAGVPLGPVMTARATAAAEERLLAVELLAEVQLELGQPQNVIPMLREVSEIHPLRERVQTLLMWALQEHGETAAALAVYRATRTALQDELGLKPGQELQRLYEQLAAPATERFGATASKRAGADARPDRKPAGIAGTVEIPDWLPWSVPRFIGREEVVQRLLDRTRRVGNVAPAVHLIDGMPGSGKTTLAVHVARLLSPSFPDARLYIDLRGHGAAAPVEPAEALVLMLRQLGLPGGRIPVHLDERVELWRRELAGRRTVVVLDNAADGEQVAPLLPTAPGSVFLITSRRRLIDLDVDPPESLPPMSEEDAIALLAACVGRHRVDEEPDAAAELVRGCGYLPLAVRLAGARLAHRRHRRIAELARQLGAESPVLQELRAGNKSVVGAFAASYEPLDPGLKRAFRLLGTHAGHYDVPMVAAVTGLSQAAAVDVLDELVDRNLVEETEGGRYRLHDLVRYFVLEKCRASDPVEVRSAAVQQLLDYALHAAIRAGEALHETVTARSEVITTEPLRPDLATCLSSGDGGVQWLERERGELVMLMRLALDQGFDAYAWKLARVLWRFFYVRGYFDDIITTQQLGLTAARRLDDKSAVVMMCNYLASGLVKTGRYPAARQCLETALELSHETGDMDQIAKLRANQAVVHWLSGEPGEAVAIGTELLCDHEVDTAFRFAYVLPNLGLALTTAGSYREALRIHRLDLFRARAVGDYFYLANALSHLAAVRVRLGQWTQAIRLLRSSLMLYDRTGHRYGESDARNLLGVAYRRLGLLGEARRQHELAIGLAEDSGERPAQCASLNDLGLTLAAGGEGDAARLTHERALALATRFEHPYEQGRALTGLAECTVKSDVDEARRYWERALAIFRRMVVPERFEVERRLAEVPDGLSQRR